MEYLPIIVVYVLLFAGLMALWVASSAKSRRERERSAARLMAIENKLDAVIAHLGASVPEPTFPTVEQLVHNGQQIEAVRQYRLETGADLLTAKRAVDAIDARLHTAGPSVS